eukprot:2510305-Ditylum_brightwellii.AAC.1
MPLLVSSLLLMENIRVLLQFAKEQHACNVHSFVLRGCAFGANVYDYKMPFFRHRVENVITAKVVRKEEEEEKEDTNRDGALKGVIFVSITMDLRT